MIGSSTSPDSPAADAARDRTPAAPAGPSRWLLYAGIAIVLVFVAAMLTQYLQMRAVRSELAVVRVELERVRSEATIGAAAAEAQQGRYEPARQLASRFFTVLQQRVADAPANRRAPLQGILDQRDAIITQLSRGDPASATNLVRMVTDYRAALRAGEAAGGDG